LFGTVETLSLLDARGLRSKIATMEGDASQYERCRRFHSAQRQKAEASDRLITKPWIGELRRDLRYQALAKAGLFLEPDASSVAR